MLLGGLAIVGGVVTVGSVAVLSGVDGAYEARGDVPGLAYGSAEIGVGAVGVLGGVLTSAFIEDKEDRVPILALSSLAVAVVAHGAWVLASDDPRAWRYAVAPVAACDGLLLVHDAAAIADPDRSPPRSFYGFAETVAAVPQLAFGLGAIANATSSSDRAAAAVFTTVPAVLALHGIVTLATARTPGRVYPPRDRDVVPRVEESRVVVLPAMLGAASRAPGIVFAGSF
jgi:hypothetical protein